MMKLKRGDVVVAIRHLDKSGSDVRPGTQGVVFEEAGFHGNGLGPLVRWMNMGVCNVYASEVAKVTR